MKCQWCEAEHGPVCPLVKAIEYHVDGTVKRVEFKTAVDYRPVLAPPVPAPFPIPYVPPPVAPPDVSRWWWVEKTICGAGPSLPPFWAN
ncbi:MAG TPA: hypothetical protein VGR91_16405 [Stellaceae bacterium]|nr:hypothetical protein [Stellaceae bacterium]